MANPVQALRALQGIDKDLFRVNAELTRLPAERAKRQATLENVREVLEEKKLALRGDQVKIKELEDSVDVQKQRIRKLEKESESNRDITVVEACRYEIRGLRRLIDETEREELNLMEGIERGKLEIERIEARLKGEIEIFEQFCQNVETELAAATLRQEDLALKRGERLDSDLDPMTLELYDRLLIARGGEALAMLDGGVCQGCFIQVPPNKAVQLARANKVIQCSSCDRIMYLP